MDSNNSMEVSVSELVELVFNRWKTLAIISFIFISAGAIYSLTLENRYTSEALVMLTNSPNNELSLDSSSRNAISSLAGLNIGPSGKNSPALAIAIIYSRDFSKRLMDFNDLAINLIAATGFDFNSFQIIYDQNIYDSSSGYWVDKDGNKSNPPDHESFHKALSNSIRAVYNPRTGFIDISVEHFSPFFAKDLLQLIIDELNLVVKNRDLQEAEESLIFLYSELEKTNVADIRVSINQLVESKLKTKMLANTKKDYLIQPIDSPHIPKDRTSPNRTRISITWFFFGLLTSLLYVIANFFLKRKS